MTVENMVHKDQTAERPTLAEIARKMMLASIGAVALLQEEAEVFIQKLIEKGELTEKDGSAFMQEFREKRKKRVEEELDKRISTVITRMNVPTKTDIQTLTEKITEIAQKVDELKK